MNEVSSHTEQQRRDHAEDPDNGVVPFPLAFTPMEHYYWCDDRQEYPACYAIELEFSGTLQREPFAEAWKVAIQRHPLLLALVDDSGSRPVWVAGQGRLPSFDWAEEGTPLVGTLDRIDLTVQPGIRCWLRIGSESSRLVFRIHHACCDGVGAAQFVEDLLVSYHHAVRGEESSVPLRTLQPAELVNRGYLAGIPPRPPWWLKMRYALAIAAFWAQLLRRTPAPLARTAGSTRQSDPSPDRTFVTELLDPTTAQALRKKATSLGVTLNELLLRDLFMTMAAWQTTNGGSDRDWLRVNVPTSLRQRSDSQLPAANRLSFAFLTRRLRSCRDGGALLQSIDQEIAEIKKGKRSLRFLGGLFIAGRVSGMLRWFLNRDRPYATAVFTNLGRVLNRTRLPRRQRRVECGNVVLEKVSSAPPIRPLTHAAFSVMTYANEVAINLRGDPTYFDSEDVSALLKAYIDRLKCTASGDT